MAQGREIFKLFGTFTMDGVEKAEKDLKGLDTSAANTDKKVSGLSTGMAKAGKIVATGGALIAGAAVAVGKLAVNSATALDEVDKMSQKIGISAKAYQEWDFILSQNGASVDGLQMGIKTMSTAIFEAGQGTQSYVDDLAALGLTYEDLNGLSQEEQFQKVFGALADMEDQTARTAIASKLLGRSATELAPALNQSSEAIEAQREQAHELGLVLDEEAVAAGVSFTDTLDQLQRSIGAGLNQVMAELLPMLVELMNLIMPLIPTIIELIAPLAQNLVPIIFDLISKLLPPLIQILTRVLDAILPILPTLLDAITDAILPILELTLELLDLIMPILIPAIQFLAQVFSKTLKGAIDTIRPIIENIINVFRNVIDFVKNIFTGNWEGAWQNIINIFKGIWEHIKNVVKAPINFIIDMINGVISGINFLINGINKVRSEGKKINLIGSIPKLAKGTDFFQGGMALVGEDPRTGEGGEVIDMPRGTRVTPRSEGGMGDTINIYANDTSASGIIRAYRRNSKLTALGL